MNRHTVLVAYAVSIFSIYFNVFGPRLLEKVSRGLLIWNVCGFICTCPKLAQGP